MTFTMHNNTPLAASVVPLIPLPRVVREGTKLGTRELERMRAGTEDLIWILRQARPDQSKAEFAFASDLEAQLLTYGHPVELDVFGNIWVTVPAHPKASGSAPRILWSCHTDTVASEGGLQGVQWRPDGVTLELKKRKPGRCLGADDGAGIWLLWQMIEAGVAGTYVFHRAEEVGRLGSQWVKKNLAHKLATFDACIAFDRKGTDNLITHQSGQRGISIAFADSMIEALSSASDGALSYVHDDTGSYTDSYTYFDTIPECCNVSIGYEREHGPNETLDVGHLWRLRCAMVRADFSELCIERDPATIEYDDNYGGGYGGGGMDGFGWPSGYRGSVPYSDHYSGNMGLVSRFSDIGSEESAGDNSGARLRALVEAYPNIAADILDQCGITVSDFAECIGVGPDVLCADGYPLDGDGDDLARGHYGT